jgi:histidine ammonia-lyase
MLELDGQQLTLEEVARVARGAEGATLGASARARMEASRRTVERIVAEERVVYGVNTGFGKLSDVTIPAAALRELQTNLVRSHACGVGPPLSVEETRAMMLLRANVLATGYSGARPAVAEALLLMQIGRAHV